MRPVRCPVRSATVRRLAVEKGATTAGTLHAMSGVPLPFAILIFGGADRAQATDVIARALEAFLGVDRDVFRWTPPTPADRLRSEQRFAAVRAGRAKLREAHWKA